MASQVEIAERIKAVRDCTYEQSGFPTGRDCGYLRFYFEQFGSEQFDIGSLVGKKLSQHIAEAFRIESKGAADAAILAVRLPNLNLLTKADDNRTFQLTERGIMLGQLLTQT